MPLDPPTDATAFQAAARETLIASLRNAHALEKQVISVLEAQLKLLDDHPELHARLKEHVVETREQVRRLEAGLEACDASASMVKDAVLSVMGLGQASVMGLAEDAVLKAVLADRMTEQLEIASYRTLIGLADMAGMPELRPRLQESLREEEAMAIWLDENLAAITRRFVDLKAEKDTAPPRDDMASPDGEQGPTLWQTLESAREANTHTKPADPRPGATPRTSGPRPDGGAAQPADRPQTANAPAAETTRQSD